MKTRDSRGMENFEKVKEQFNLLMAARDFKIRCPTQFSKQCKITENKKNVIYVSYGNEPRISVITDI